MTTLMSSAIPLGVQIEADIRQRGLRPGDRYLTAADVGRLLNVSTMTANRAMQELADCQVLVRARRTGTFIGTGFVGARSTSLRCVHLLVYPDYFRVAKSHLDQIVSGLHCVLPEAAIQLTFLPSDDLGFIRQLVENATGCGTFAGAVLFTSPPSVQQFFAEAGVPAVVSGSVYPEAAGLPWVDRDQHRIGRLLTGHVLRNGHRRVAVIMRDRWGFGDNLMLDGVQAALSEARLGFEALVVRSVPAEPGSVAAVVRNLLGADDPPTALICRTHAAADAAAASAREYRRRGRKNVGLVLADFHGDERDAIPYAHTAAVLDGHKQGELIGSMLGRLAQGERPEPDHHVIDVELRCPTE